MKYSLIDTHCHIHFAAYKDEVDNIVRRAQEASIGMITAGTQRDTSRDAIAFAEKYDGVFATIGLHPGHLHKQEYSDPNELVGDMTPERFDDAIYKEMAAHPKVVAIGEFGLDYYHKPPGIDPVIVRDDQMNEVRAQLRFASEVGKPVVIHCRDAHDDQFALLKEEIDRGGLARRGVIHCFTGTPAEAARYRDIGFFVSFTGIVTFGKNVMESAKDVPLESMLIETDSPYLAPAPFRGKRNEPLYVRHVAEKIAELKGISAEEVARVTTENAVRLFGLR